jgi:hypothetical protein
VPSTRRINRSMNAQVGDEAPYDGNSPFLFVSYSHTDLHYILELVRQFGSRFRLWYDRGLRGGQNFSEEIARRIATCSGFVAVLSNRCIEPDSFVAREISFAASQQKLIIPVYIESCVLTPALAFVLHDRHYLAWSSPNFAQDLSRAFPSICQI